MGRGEIHLLTPQRIICEAISNRCRLEFEYDGLLRIVEPYCHGITSAGNESLRAIQVGGDTRARQGYGFGKLWTVAKMTNLRVAAQFKPRDPNYNPSDSAMPSLQCRLA